MRLSHKTKVLIILVLICLVVHVLPICVLVWPYIYGVVFFDPPKVGEAAESLRERLGQPVVDHFVDRREGCEASRRLGYASPDGRRFIVLLDEENVVIEVKVESR